MERDLERRYQSAADLAADLRRFLRGDPIDAKRDSLSYVFARRLHRQRGRVMVVGCVAALAAVLFVQTVSARRSGSPRHASECLQAMVRAYNAHAHGDQAAYKQSLANLEAELGEDESHVVAIIDQTIPSLMASGTSGYSTK